MFRKKVKLNNPSFSIACENQVDTFKGKSATFGPELKYITEKKNEIISAIEFYTVVMSYIAGEFMTPCSAKQFSKSFFK